MNNRRYLRLASLACGLLLAMTSCASAPRETDPVVAQPAPPVPSEPAAPEKQELATQPQLEGREPVRIALLLPFTSPVDNIRKAAEALSNAAQLAAFDSAESDYLLIPKDTRGTSEGAAQMAREAINEGAEIILGPLLSQSVLAAAAIARPAGVPMISFSSDVTIAGKGVYLLSYPPEMEVARITDYAMKNNYSRFGLLAPATEYGDRVSTSFAEEVYVRGGIIVREERYEQSPDAMLQPAKRLAQYAAKSGRALIPAGAGQGPAGTGQGPELGPGLSAPSPSRAPQSPPFRSGSDALGDDPIGDLAARNLPRQTDNGNGFEAVLMPEQGTLLRALAPLLPYYDVNVKEIKLLGVSAWNNPRLAREPALAGGWFAAPDPVLSIGFKKRYRENYNAAPPRLASLSYDAVLLTARLARHPRGNRFTPEKLADPSGYLGADGLFRLTPDGRVERGLAILEIQPGGIKVIDPAPQSFAPAATPASAPANTPVTTPFGGPNLGPVSVPPGDGT